MIPAFNRARKETGTLIEALCRDIAALGDNRNIRYLLIRKPAERGFDHRAPNSLAMKSRVDRGEADMAGVRVGAMTREISRGFAHGFADKDLRIRSGASFANPRFIKQLRGSAIKAGVKKKPGIRVRAASKGHQCPEVGLAMRAHLYVRGNLRSQPSGAKRQFPLKRHPQIFECKAVCFGHDRCFGTATVG